jgi:Na+-driven multidrug efflux pump
MIAFNTAAAVALAIYLRRSSTTIRLALSRLDYLLIPLLFGLGTATVTMVGVNVGAGHHARARSVAWAGALMSIAATASIGVAALLFPEAWMHIFSREADVVAIGAAYLVRVAPLYAFTGLGMALYFASQGAGRMLWPFAAGVLRLAMVLLAGSYWLYMVHGSISGLFWIVASSQIVFGAINAIAMTSARAWNVVPAPLQAARA